MVDSESPVDHGWAWVVMLCSLVAHILVGGAVYSVSVLNVLFIEAFEDTRANTAWIGALAVALLHAAGIFSSVLVSWIDFRWTVVIGGVLVSAGCALSALATALWHVIITFGLLTGLGFGLIMTPVCAVIGLNFNKYLIIAAAVASLGAGIGPLFMAPLVQELADELGWRSAMLILGGIELHLCICGALIRPVTRLPSSSGCGSHGQTCVKQTTTVKHSVFQQLSLLMKNKRYSSFCLCCFFISTGHWIFYTHMSAYAITCGSSRENAAFLMSIAGVLSMFARLFMPFAATDKNIGALLMAAGSLGLNGMLLLLMPFLMAYDWGQILVAALFGFYGNGYLPLKTKIMIDVVGVDLLTMAYGASNVMHGLGALISPPMAGWLFDVTSSYQYSFFLSGILVFLSFVCLLVIPTFPPVKTEAESQLPEKPEVEFSSNYSLILVTP